jgi:hypothetical protein
MKLTGEDFGTCIQPTRQVIIGFGAMKGAAPMVLIDLAYLFIK